MPAIEGSSAEVPCILYLFMCHHHQCACMLWVPSWVPSMNLPIQPCIAVALWQQHAAEHSWWTADNPPAARLVEPFQHACHRWPPHSRLTHDVGKLVRGLLLLGDSQLVALSPQLCFTGCQSVHPARRAPCFPTVVSIPNTVFTTLQRSRCTLLPSHSWGVASSTLLCRSLLCSTRRSITCPLPCLSHYQMHQRRHGCSPCGGREDGGLCQSLWQRDCHRSWPAGSLQARSSSSRGHLHRFQAVVRAEPACRCLT